MLRGIIGTIVGATIAVAFVLAAANEDGQGQQQAGAVIEFSLGTLWTVFQAGAGAVGDIVMDEQGAEDTAPLIDEDVK